MVLAFTDRVKLKTQFKNSFDTLKLTFSNWSDDHGSLLSAGLAYYTMFSLAPLLMITIAVAGLIFGAEASRGEIYGSISGLLGPQGATAVQSMIQSAGVSKTSGVLATIVGVFTLILGAGGVFTSLQEALNTIWGVKPKPGGGIKSLLRQRLLSFGMVAGIAFLLLVSLLASAAVAALGKYLSRLLPGSEVLWQIVNSGISLVVTVFLFALIFKVLPDVKVKWRSIWEGALFTAVLFIIGKTGIGIYLGKASVASSYGAAGSIILVLLWLYYSSTIFFLGAEFTKIRSNQRGYPLAPKDGAELISTHALPPGEQPKEHEAKFEDKKQPVELPETA